MAGRIAEELCLGKHVVCTGARSDIERATEVAREYVMDFGFTPAFNFVDLGSGSGSWAQETLARRDQLILELVHKCYNRTTALLDKHKGKLEELAERLVEKETLYAEEIRNLMMAASTSRAD